MNLLIYYLECAKEESCFQSELCALVELLKAENARQQIDSLKKVLYIMRGCFSYYYHFSIKSYVVDIYQNRLAEVILIDSHNIRFYGEIIIVYPFE